ncbi:MAG: Kelch repeat-containing protein [Planctomycetota bacterium]
MRHPLFVSCLFAAAAALPAQGDFDLDKVSAGTLGAPLTLQVRNATANMPCLVMASFTAGPLPIALIDPLDTRSVEVGLDLIDAWFLLTTNGSGGVQFAIGLPNDPAFQGGVLYWQCATLPGVTTLFDELSNPLVVHLGQPSTSAALPNPLLAPRAAATVCWNRLRDAGAGDVVLASGGTSEIVGFRSLASVAGPAMQTARGLYAAATLNDGRVLFTGGVDGTAAVTTSCEIYDPATNTFAPVAPLNGPRAGHAAATLPDGRVMVVGGTTNFTDITTAATGSRNTVEIYTPVTNTWAAGPAIGGRRLVPSLTRLSTGRMLVAGGIEITVLFGIPIGATSTIKAQLYNPATNTWSNAANMPSGRAYHQDSQVTLADGRVLLSGGVLVPDLINAANSASIANADVYNPATNTWVATTMSRARTGHSATRLASGQVIVCGGAEGLLSAAIAIDAVARFDAATNSWVDLSPLTQPRAGHSAALLPDGHLLILGGGTTSGEALHF